MSGGHAHRAIAHKDRCQSRWQNRCGQMSLRLWPIELNLRQVRSIVANGTTAQASTCRNANLCEIPSDTLLSEIVKESDGFGSLMMKLCCLLRGVAPHWKGVHSWLLPMHGPYNQLYWLLSAAAFRIVIIGFGCSTAKSCDVRACMLVSWRRRCWFSETISSAFLSYSISWLLVWHHVVVVAMMLVMMMWLSLRSCSWGCGLWIKVGVCSLRLACDW